MKAADKTLAKRYARAYMALEGEVFAEPAGADEAAAKNRIGELEKVRNAAGPFRRLFLHPLVGYSDKKEILAKLLSGDLSASGAAQFLRLLLKENRFYLLDTILEDCAGFYNIHAGIVRADVSSRYPLAKEEFGRLEKDISAALGKKVLVTRIAAERVIGGLEIKINDLLIDATIKGRLERLKKSILAG
ncbi:MAG: ATP synthase F1 subunit delta [Elusimicrobia bacterium]|nr:ATP synthase F1 subunit delta [Elusimicrobiota bacterium]